MIAKINKNRHYYLSLMVIISFLFSGCFVKYKPDKVWHLRDKVVALAKSIEGCYYKYGGQDIDGFDCSGYVWYVYDCYGLKIPRNAKKQRNVGKKIPFERAKPGDILIFRIKGGLHSGIFLSKEQFIHSPNSNSKVRIEEINRFWKRKVVAVVRVIKE